MSIEERRFVIRLSERALVSLLLNCLEAYSISNLNIKGKGHPRKRLEIAGCLFGNEIAMKSGEVLYQIEMANVDTTARQERSSVHQNYQAALIKVNLVSSFWPHLEYLGDFHSHPYGKYNEVYRDEGFSLSETDRKDILEDENFWKGLNYRVGIVITIGSMERASRKECISIADNCLEATLGNFKVWITAYCAYESGGKLVLTEDKDPSVILDCPSLNGLRWEHVDFGRVKEDGAFSPSRHFALKRSNRFRI